MEEYYKVAAIIQEYVVIVGDIPVMLLKDVGIDHPRYTLVFMEVKEEWKKKEYDYKFRTSYLNK